MDFVPRIAEPLQVMDARIFVDTPMQLRPDILGHR